MKDKIKCPNCGWGWVRYRLRTDDFICTHCGHVFKKETKTVKEQ